MCVCRREFEVTKIAKVGFINATRTPSEVTSTSNVYASSFNSAAILFSLSSLPVSFISTKTHIK